MTEIDEMAGSTAEASPPRTPEVPRDRSSAPSARLPGRIVNWFWRGRQLKELKRDGAARSPHARALAQQAELLLELGRRAIHPNERLPGSATAVAAELYRQSAYFAVRALALESPPSNSEDRWRRLPSPLEQKLDRECGVTPDELTRLVEQPSFTEHWSLPEELRSLRAAQLARIARIVLDEVNWHERASEDLWIQRLARIGMIIAIVGGSIALVQYLRDRSEQAGDLAYNKPWRSSSSMSGFGCSSPLQRCADSPDFFFHTLEEKGPWIELDLGRSVRFGTVRIDNRRDCCFDRATPLIVEVSADQQNFREVAQRAKSFSTWRATFSPVEARYVRVRAPARTMLHLYQVRVLL